MPSITGAEHLERSALGNLTTSVATAWRGQITTECLLGLPHFDCPWDLRGRLLSQCSQAEQLLLRYANHLLEGHRDMEAVELYRKVSSFRGGSISAQAPCIPSAAIFPGTRSILPKLKCAAAPLGSHLPAPNHVYMCNARFRFQCSCNVHDDDLDPPNNPRLALPRHSATRMLPACCQKKQPSLQPPVHPRSALSRCTFWRPSRWRPSESSLLGPQLPTHQQQLLLRTGQLQLVKLPSKERRLQRLRQLLQQRWQG